MIVVVGAGPSGVSAARPLIERGHDVVWLDAGEHYERIQLPTQPFSAIAPGRDLSDLMLGDLANAGGQDSPKLRAPSIRRLLWQEQPASIATEGFQLVGSYSAGGLSNAWGAMVATYSQSDLGMDPDAWSDLADCYRELADEIGISGPHLSQMPDAVLADVESLQAPLPLDAPADALFANYEAQQSKAGRVRLGRPYQALLTQPHAARPACDRRLMCLWGCSRGSIYSARHSLADLAQRANVDYRPNHQVTAIRRGANGRYTLAAKSGGGSLVSIETDRVFLAAGAPQSLALALDCVRPERAVTRLLSTPSFAFVLITAAQLGRAPQKTGYAMAQLIWSVEDGASTSGAIYTTDGLPLSEIAQHFPLTRRGSTLFGNATVSAMMPVNGFLASDYSDNRAELKIDAAGIPVLKITGGHHPSATRIARLAAGLVSTGLRPFGAIAIPGSFRMVAPGADIHYGGGLPMASAAGSRQPLETDALGQLDGFANLHVVDGAVLPRLTSAHPTFTMMANARRIGKAIASGEPGR